MAIRVANIIEDARLAGPQTRIAEVAKGLKNEKIFTTVIIPIKDNRRFKSRLEAYGIENIELPLNRLTKEPYFFFQYCCYFFLEIFWLYSILKKGRFELAHVSGGAWQIKGVIAGKLAGCRVIWHLNDTCMPLGIRVVCKILSKLCVDGLIVAGEKVKDYYVSNLRLKKIPVFKIQAPVDTAYFVPRNGDPSKKRLMDDSINIVSVGNINPLKGYESFIKLAAKFRYNDKLKFYIVGDTLDSQKQYYQKLFKMKKCQNIDKLIFYGPSDKIRDVLSKTDIYVCSSKSEASPIAVWEAMSMKKPVISTEVGDIPHIIQNNHNGLLVPYGKEKLFYEKLSILLENPKLRVKLGENARKTVIEKLDISKIVRQHKEAYVGTLNKNEEHC